MKQLLSTKSINSKSFIDDKITKKTTVLVLIKIPTFVLYCYTIIYIEQ